MIERGREWQAYALRDAAHELLTSERLSVVDRAYYTGIADLMQTLVAGDEALLVWPEKVGRLMDTYHEAM